MYKLIANITLLLIPIFGTAQNSMPDIESFNRVNSNSLQYCSFIYKDSEGLVWLSSMDGVFKYNGFEIVSYEGINVSSCPTNFDTGKKYLGSNVQSHFFEDEEANIWFSTYRGINKYNRIEDNFSRIQLKDEDGQCINEEYKLIHLDRAGKLLLRAGSNLYSFDSKTLVAKKICDVNGVRFAVEEDKAGHVNCIVSIPWINANGFEVIYFDEKDEFIKKESYFNESKNREVQTRSVTITESGNFWIYSNVGLIKFNTTTCQKGKLYSFQNESENKESFVIGTILNDSIILANSQANLFLFDITSEEFLNRNGGIDLSGPLETIYKDSDDHLWISYFEGSNVVHNWIHENPFYAIPFKDEMNWPEVTAVLETGSGNIWFSTGIKGIYEVSENLESTTKVGAPSKGVTQFLLDEQQAIWAIYQNGILKYDEGQWQNIPSPAQTRISWINHLDENWKLFLSSRGFLNYIDGSFVQDQSEEFNQEELFAAHSFLTTDNHLLVPFRGNDILVFKLDVEHKSRKLVDTISINLDVISFCEISTDHYLFGTNHGLWEYKVGALKQYDFDNIAVNKATVVGILKDEEENIWVATNKGLIKIDTDSKEEYIFREEDGLPSSNFSLYAHTKLSGGRLLFTTDKGPVVFDPKEIKPNPYKSKIIIHEVTDANEQSYTDLNPNHVNEYDLNHNQNDLMIKAVASGFYLNELNTIKYRLKGHDPQWQYAKNGDMIRYFGLNPQQYKFEIQGINANGVFGPMKTIDFDINPPWWTSWWFLLLSIGGFSSILWLITRTYYRRKLRKQEIIIEKQKALQDERARIASELHDDLGSNLSSIRFMSSLVKRQMDDSSSKDKIDRIFSTAGDLMEKMEDIIWATNPENDSLENLFIHIREYSSQYLEMHELNYDFDFPIQMPSGILGGEKRRNILLVVKEILHNIVKHAQASKVKLHARMSDTNLIFSIEDNGIGMAQGKMRKGGNGIKNIKNRLGAMEGKVEFFKPSENGCKVILEIPLQDVTPN